MQLSGVRPSVRLYVMSVCPIRPPHAAAAGLLLHVDPAARRSIDYCTVGGQQHPRRSTARSSKCGHCHVVS